MARRFFFGVGDFLARGLRSTDDGDPLARRFCSPEALTGPALRFFPDPLAGPALGLPDSLAGTALRLFPDPEQQKH